MASFILQERHCVGNNCALWNDVHSLVKRTVMTNEKSNYLIRHE